MQLTLEAFSRKVAEKIAKNVGNDGEEGVKRGKFWVEKRSMNGSNLRGFSRFLEDFKLHYDRRKQEIIVPGLFRRKFFPFIFVKDIEKFRNENIIYEKKDSFYVLYFQDDIKMREFCSKYRLPFLKPELIFLATHSNYRALLPKEEAKLFESYRKGEPLEIQ